MGILSWTENPGEEMFMGFNLSKLARDEAYLNISSSAKVYLYSVYKECAECPFTKELTVDGNANLTVSTRYAQLFRVLDQELPTSPNNSERNVICTLDEDFGEFGVYNLDISRKCRLDVLKEPVSIYFPILTVLLIYILFFAIAASAFCVWKVYFQKLDRQTEPESKEAEKVQQRRRLKSLDTFRGISIVMMIFVNFGAGGYEVLDHAVWNGLQFADVIFPWFMWIMGVCIPISVSSIFRKGISKKSALVNVLRRSCILFALGLLVGAGKNLDQLRVFGVLQRFGICYFLAASSFIILSQKSQFEDSKDKSWKFVKDIYSLRYQWLVAIVLLIIHSLLIFTVVVPGCPIAYLGPGGLHKNASYAGCTGGATGYVDSLILGNHIYRFPVITRIYKSQPFDPEGILGCLTSVVQVIIGAQAGAIVLIYKEHSSRIIRWMIWGVLIGVIGGLLSGFSKEDGVIPVNKHLWSLSFVLVTSSLAFILLTICYFIIDVKHFWTGKPFLFAGMNAIFMYVGHSICFHNFPFRWVPNHAVGLNTHFLTLLENVWATSLWVLVAYYLYTIDFFLSV